MYYHSVFFPVTLDETLRLLYKYRTLTSAKIDRVTFCDLLHDFFGMTDDYFMDKGRESRKVRRYISSNICALVGKVEKVGKYISSNICALVKKIQNRTTDQ